MGRVRAGACQRPWWALLRVDAVLSGATAVATDGARASLARRTTSRPCRSPALACGVHDGKAAHHAGIVHLDCMLHLDRLSTTGALHGATSSSLARAAALLLGVPSR